MVSEEVIKVSDVDEPSVLFNCFKSGIGAVTGEYVQLGLHDFQLPLEDNFLGQD